MDLLVADKADDERDAPTSVRNRLCTEGLARFYWVVVLLVALVAYAAVLRIGFMDDDYVLLYWAHKPGFDWRALLPGSSWFFYRPVGVFLTWELGWELWGMNPLPYHLVGLVLHGVTSAVLCLWLADLTGRRAFGLLAGVLFAAFPLHMEAVGWVATQWDVWATLFGLLSAWSFSAWWRSGARNWSPYLASVACYGLAIWAKESLLTFLPVLAVAAWIASPPGDWRGWKRLTMALVPHGALIGLNLALRLVILGDLGNYRPVRSDYDRFFWDNLIAYFHPLLAPVNSTVLGGVTAQAVGAVSTALLLLGLIWFGRGQRSMLLLVGSWIVLSLLPIMSIPGVRSSDLLQNRYLYLTGAGYCAGVAALLYAAASRARRAVTAAVGLAVGLLIVTCWLQLRPWATATTRVNEIVEGVMRLIPPESRSQGMAWYVEKMPEEYKGAYMLRRGLGLSRLLLTGDVEYPNVERVDDASSAPLNTDGRDAFAMRFTAVDDGSSGVFLDYLQGITGPAEPPGSSGGVDNGRVWDFRKCEEGGAGEWQVVEARATCAPGRGLVMRPGGNDPKLVGPATDLRSQEGSARFLKLRVAASYVADGGSAPHLSEWFWASPGHGFDPEHSRNLTLKQDGTTHVYWTVVPLANAGGEVGRLRFDPVDGPVEATVEWIAADLVR